MVVNRAIIFVCCILFLGQMTPTFCGECDDASVQVHVISPVLTKLVKDMKKLKKQVQPAAVVLGAFTAGALVYTTWHLNSFLSKQVSWLTKACVYRPCVWLKNKIWGGGVQQADGQGESTTEKACGKIAEWSSFVGLWLLQAYMLKDQYMQAQSTVNEIMDSLNKIGWRDVTVNIG